MQDALIVAVGFALGWLWATLEARRRRQAEARERVGRPQRPSA